MKVKVGNETFDDRSERVMVILTDKDKENIKNMLPGTTNYCSYPRGMFTEDEIKEWMKE